MVEAFWDTTAATEAGVAWERILFTWSQLQPNGPDDWNTLHVPDEWLQWAQTQGREVVGLLKNTPYWATDADPPLEASPPRGLDLPIDDPGNLWAAFVRRTVTFFSQRGVRRWIIWNEPDIAPGVYGQEWAGTMEQYYRLLKVAYLVIKQVDPTAHVHLAGLTYWHNQSWLSDFLAVATADPEGAAHGYFFDVVSLHIYFQTHSVDLIVNQARAALGAYGLDKPIWINETNASPDADPQWPLARPRWRVDLREQASFILQAYALGLAAGAQRIAVYKLIDAGLPPGGEPFGLLRPDHSRRPAYTAYRVVTQHYAGTRSAQIQRQPLMTQVTLDQGERTTRVFWARTRSDVSLQVPALANEALLIDQEGNSQGLDGSSGSYDLVLPGARCADEVLGCIIGGPTYLLIENAPAGASAPPSAGEVSEDQVTPTAQSADSDDVATDDSPVAHVTATLTATLTPTATATVRPTPHAVTLPPSPTLTPSDTPSPTPTPSPTSTSSPTPPPSPTASPTATPSPNPTATASATLSTTPGASPIPRVAATVAPAGGTARHAGIYVLGGLVGLLVLLGLLLWRWRRG
jgi:hypothetical protein